MITTAVCKTYKRDIPKGIHTSAHTYKIALFTSAATLNKDTTTYTGQTGEVASGGGYTTGGATLSGFSCIIDGDKAVLSWDTPIDWDPSTITARGALIYNNSLAGKDAVMAIDFGADKTSTDGRFRINLPTQDQTTGLIRLN